MFLLGFGAVRIGNPLYLIVEIVENTAFGIWALHRWFATISNFHGKR
jgi:hypothetical protein